MPRGGLLPVPDDLTSARNDLWGSLGRCVGGPARRWVNEQARKKGRGRWDMSPVGPESEAAIPTAGGHLHRSWCLGGDAASLRAVDHAGRIINSGVWALTSAVRVDSGGASPLVAPAMCRHCAGRW